MGKKPTPMKKKTNEKVKAVKPKVAPKLPVKKPVVTAKAPADAKKNSSGKPAAKKDNAKSIVHAKSIQAPKHADKTPAKSPAKSHKVEGTLSKLSGMVKNLVKPNKDVAAKGKKPEATSKKLQTTAHPAKDVDLAKKESHGAKKIAAKVVTAPKDAKGKTDKVLPVDAKKGSAVSAAKTSNVKIDKSKVVAAISSLPAGKKDSAKGTAGKKDGAKSAQPESKIGTEKEQIQLASDAKKMVDEANGPLESARKELVDHIGELAEHFNLEEIRKALNSVNFFTAGSTDECSERGCDNLSTTLGHCRLHYIGNWKDLQRKKIILEEGKLAAMVEDLVRRYPIKFIEVLRDDLVDEKNFYTLLKNLNIDSTYDFDEVEDIDLDSDTDIAPEARAATVRAFEDDSDI